jgi:hypothetical protein
VFGPLLLFHPANLSFLPLHRLLAIVRDDEVCRRLMTTPRSGADLSRHRLCASPVPQIQAKGVVLPDRLLSPQFLPTLETKFEFHNFLVAA